MTENSIDITGAGQTENDGQGFTRDAKSDLFLLAVTDFVENTFYESVEDRNERFAKLVHEVVKQDPAWIPGFANWLRNKANIRSRSAALAAEYHRGIYLAGYPKDAPATADVVVAACARADEPAEVLGYWLGRYGRPVPIALRRGLGEAARKLYDQRTSLRYDGDTRGVRMGDVLELTHVTPKDQTQSDLFKFLITKRHRGIPEAVKQITPGSLPTIEAAAALEAVSEQDRRSILRVQGPTALADAGFSWEKLSGWLPGGMDAEAWEAIIPTLPYMATLRNLANFDRANISVSARQTVIDRLVDPAQIDRSRQFPFRFYSAYKQLDSIYWMSALETALEISVKNIPEFDGRTLVMVDVSGSMNHPISERSKIMRWEVGALFGAVLAKKSVDADLVLFATESVKMEFTRSASILRVVDGVEQKVGTIGYGTHMWKAADEHYDGHDRVVMFTDMQTTGQISPLVDAKCKFFHGYNLAGHAVTTVDSARNGRFEYGGFSDSSFNLMSIVEQFGDVGWPWEI